MGKIIGRHEEKQVKVRCAVERKEEGTAGGLPDVKLAGCGD